MRSLEATCTSDYPFVHSLSDRILLDSDAFSNKVKLSMEQMQAAIYASQETLLFRVDQSTADINQQLGFSTSAIINKV